MPAGKKAVGRDPILSEKELERINPIWLHRRVPHRYWQNPQHRRDFLLWLIAKLRFRFMEDLYKLTQTHVMAHRGHSLLSHWRQSVVEGVKEVFPQYEWQEWLFAAVPLGFWGKQENRHRYMRWLGKRLGYHRPEDWYAVREKDFDENGGHCCLQYYRWSAKLAAMDLYPKHTWHPWKFETPTAGFWHNKENRKQYIEWLGKRLGFRRPADWYKVRTEDFRQNGGGGLLRVFGSHVDVLRDCLPELDWTPRPGVRKLAAASRPPRVPPPLSPHNRRGRRHAPRLSIKQILAWADAYHKKTGRWPVSAERLVPGAPKETWGAINAALSGGNRGLPSGFTLPRLLAKYRGVTLRRSRPVLSIDQILKWADQHRKRTGKWPTFKSGPITGQPGEDWNAVNRCLYSGGRGLPGGSSLARLGAKYRGVRNKSALPKLTVAQVLKWADRHHQRTGKWPNLGSGVIEGSGGETWRKLNMVLRVGHRGLPQGMTLAKLLSQKRGVPTRRGAHKLSVELILKWADQHHRRTGKWPHQKSGSVLGVPGEKWRAIDAALRVGCRSLPGGSSLPRLLAKHRGRRNRSTVPPLSVEKILKWARHHHRKTGEWPAASSGPVLAAPEEGWQAINAALTSGCRGLPGGITLQRLLEKHRLKKK